MGVKEREEDRKTETKRKMENVMKRVRESQTEGWRVSEWSW